MPTYAVPNVEQQVRRRPAGLRRALPGDDPADAHVSKEGTFLERRRAEWRTLLEVVWRGGYGRHFLLPFAHVCGATVITTAVHTQNQPVLSELWWVVVTLTSPYTSLLCRVASL